MKYYIAPIGCPLIKKDMDALKGAFDGPDSTFTHDPAKFAHLSTTTFMSTCAGCTMPSDMCGARSCGIGGFAE